MAFLQLLVISLVLVGFVVLAMGIRLLLDKKATFTSGSCQSAARKDGSEEFSCGCGVAGECGEKKN
ncbi:MAG: hypothetical protein JXJ22_06020 [Bacteroidales bacterium]|nr:hypothetical protein [Bacteroidales bacterium]